MTSTSPSSNFATAFASSLNVNRTVTFSIASGVVGSASVGTWYYSVRGDASETDDAVVAGTAASQITTAGGVTGTVAYAAS